MSGPAKLIAVEHRDAKPSHPALDLTDIPVILFADDEKRPCFTLHDQAGVRRLRAGYYVGAAWLRSGALVVQVTPKVPNIDHAGMLFACLRHPSVAPYVAGLYTLQADAPLIAVERQHDLLTPLLVTHFLQLLRAIVRKGVKKGYVPVAEELRARVKGKVDVARTIRQGVFKQRFLTTACRYEEFSPDIPENRFLKRVLCFVERFVAAYPTYYALLAPTLAYCTPAFGAVREEADAGVLRHATRRNPLFAEYAEAQRVGQLLLARFGYTLENVAPDPANPQTVFVPPHWVDMSKLFELHVLGLLKDRFGEKAVLYGEEQVKGHKGVIPDFLVKTDKDERWIMDAKYKPVYQDPDGYDLENIRQISAYARDRRILINRLGYSAEESERVLPECLILYPAEKNANPGSVIRLEKDLKKERIEQYTRFFKSPVLLPTKC